MGKVYEQLANEQGIFRRCEKLRICSRAGKQTKGIKHLWNVPRKQLDELIKTIVAVYSCTSFPRRCTLNRN